MVEDILYTYQYSYDSVGNKLITITNDNNNDIDMVTTETNANGTVIYVNGETAGNVYSANNTDVYQQTSWGQTTLRIDWNIDFEGAVSDTYSLLIPFGMITTRDVNLAE